MRQAFLPLALCILSGTAAASAKQEAPASGMSTFSPSYVVLLLEETGFAAEVRDGGATIAFSNPQGIQGGAFMLGCDDGFAACGAFEIGIFLEGLVPPALLNTFHADRSSVSRVFHVEGQFSVAATLLFADGGVTHDHVRAHLSLLGSDLEDLADLLGGGTATAVSAPGPSLAQGAAAARTGSVTYRGIDLPRDYVMTVPQLVRAAPVTIPSAP